jgi:hypothetical protein
MKTITKNRRNKLIRYCHKNPKSLLNQAMAIRAISVIRLINDKIKKEKLKRYMKCHI